MCYYSEHSKIDCLNGIIKTIKVMEKKRPLLPLCCYDFPKLNIFGNIHMYHEKVSTHILTPMDMFNLFLLCKV